MADTLPPTSVRTEDEEAMARTDRPRGAKRARYVQKACIECQSRKIKCEGGIPCNKCRARGRNCVLGNGISNSSTASISRDGAQTAVAVDASQSMHNPQSKDSTTAEILNRLVQLEQCMHAILQSGRGAHNAPGDHQPAVDSPSLMDPGTVRTVESNDGSRQTFAGEMSMPDLSQIESQPHASGRGIVEPVAEARPLTPRAAHGRSIIQATSKIWLREVQSAHGIIPDKAEYCNLLDIFFEEVHVLYPYLHKPSILEDHDYLWRNSMLVSCTDLEQSGRSKLSVALVFVGLALGRCTASSRMDTTDGVHSAGWAFYNIAMDLSRPSLDLTSDTTITLPELQLLVLMVIYLFRLDASEKAERILANAISAAHVLKLHKQASYSRLSAFDDEMLTRLWWILFILDRRLSLESGRPFLIQEANIDVRLPLNISDIWLTRHRTTTSTMQDIKEVVDTELALSQHTVVPYLEALINQSRVATDVWNIVYRSAQNISETMSIVHDSLDTTLDHWWQVLPKFLRYEETTPYQEQFTGMDWWRVKQCLSLHTRYAFLKLLLRKTLSQTINEPITNYRRIRGDALCAERAASIVGIFENIPRTFPKYSFTFMHPMMSATMILYSITIRNPALWSAYMDRILFAVNSLITYCQKTWVSGKMIRTVSSLNKIVQERRNPHADPQQDLLPPGRDDGSLNLQDQTYSTWPPQQTTYRQASSLQAMNDSLKSHQQAAMIPSPSSSAAGQARQSTQQDSSFPQPLDHVMTATTEFADLDAFGGDFLDLPDWAINDFEFEQTLDSFNISRLTGLEGIAPDPDADLADILASMA
ncbi:Fungal specific transcription factor domain-containing protein 63 [Elsinoe fawcettii]|nr:Fungal specific transcription factor domain-containing protein 63 [Elsinoe fawcettii]